MGPAGGRSVEEEKEETFEGANMMMAAAMPASLSRCPIPRGPLRWRVCQQVLASDK